MASGREKRSTAGNRLNKVLNEEVEADEFYATTYGGFNEIENDDDYKSEEEADDQVDSDFSIEETDEVISDHEGEEGSKKRKGVVTKAYKDPKGSKSTGKAEKRKSEKTKDKTEKKESAKRTRTESRDSSERVGYFSERKSLRKATVEKSAEIAKRIKERSQVKKKLPLKKNEYYKPTQEELLEEAKITEQENIKSLERYQKMELEKKKCRVVKKVYTGPTIKYHSLSMPLIEEIKPVTRSNTRTVSESEISIDVVKTEDSDVDVATTVTVSEDIKPDISQNGTIIEEQLKDVTKKPEEDNTKDKQDKVGPRYERTFITFSDEATFKAACPWADSKPQIPPPLKMCPFTRQKAKYFDPVSQTPYNNAQAFKVLREAYYMQLEKAINNGTVEGVEKEELNKWLQWRQKEKENKLKRLSVLPQAGASVVQPVATSLPS